MQKTILILLTIIFSACLTQNQIPSFKGFWEGPHPITPNKKFYIQIENLKDSTSANGFWTENKFYQSSFDVDSISIYGNEIRFRIPDWDCFYTGKRTNNKIVRGGFNCLGEEFDSVQLVKNNWIENHLIYPKPEYKNQTFEYVYSVPFSKNDKLETLKFSTSDDSIFIHSLVSEIINKQYGRINSFLILKNNKLICEEYFYGYKQKDLHQIESCTKSVTSLLIGIAIDKGYISDINEPVSNIFPEYPHLQKGGYKELTIEHLLTMTAGFEIENGDNFQTDTRIDLALKRELKYHPGTTFQYDGRNTEILGKILKRKTGFYPDEFAEKYLFNLLNITDFSWDGVNQGRFPLMSGSLCLKPRDMIKIGSLVLNKGVCDRKQILSENWIQESTKVKTNTHIPGNDYSYHWWNLQLESKGKMYDVVWANGWGSQFIYIVPEIDVVIATTGHNYEYDSWAITEGIREYLYLLDSK